MVFGSALQGFFRLARNAWTGNIATKNMDINIGNFHSRLPSFLQAVSDAHFIAIDLELSGIPGHQINKPRAVGEHAIRGGKATLQERYEDTKKAAETYQVLQLGITCVEENRHRGMFIQEEWNTMANVYLIQVYIPYRHSISS